MSVNSLIVNPTHALLTSLPSDIHSLEGLASLIAANEGSQYAPVPKSLEAGVNKALSHVRDALALVQEFQEQYVATNVG